MATIFTPFVSGATLFAAQLNTALTAVVNLVGTVQTATTAAAAVAATAETDAQTAISDASAAQATANAAVKKVMEVAPDSTGNVALTVANLPISAGANITISPTGVIAGAAGGGGTSPPVGILTKPLAANFTVPVSIASSSSTFVDAASGPVLTVPAVTATQLVGAGKLLTTASGAVFTAEIVLQALANPNSGKLGFGFLIFDTKKQLSNTQFWGVTFGVASATAWSVASIGFFNDGSQGGTAGPTLYTGNPVTTVRLKLVSDGTTGHLFMSNNGEVYIPVLSAAAGGLSGPTVAVGPAIYSSNTSGVVNPIPLVIQCLSYTQS